MPAPPRHRGHFGKSTLQKLYKAVCTPVGMQQEGGTVSPSLGFQTVSFRSHSANLSARLSRPLGSLQTRFQTGSIPSDEDQFWVDYQNFPTHPPLSLPMYDIFSGAVHIKRPYGALKLFLTGGSVVGVDILSSRAQPGGSLRSCPWASSSPATPGTRRLSGRRRYGFNNCNTIVLHHIILHDLLSIL